MEPVVERLLEFIKYKYPNTDGSADIQEFAKELGYGNAEKIYRLFRKEGARPSVATIEDISKRFEDFNAEWLFTGKGDMLKNGGKGNSTPINLPVHKNTRQKYPYQQVDEPAKADNSENIPVFITNFPALGVLLRANHKGEFIPDYYMNIPEYAGCIACKLHSETLIYRIPKESYIFIQQVTEWKKFLETGRRYEVRLYDGRKLHYIVHKSKNKKTFWLVPENDAFESFELPMELIESIWIIRGHLPPPEL